MDRATTIPRAMLPPTGRWAPLALSAAVLALAAALLASAGAPAPAPAPSRIAAGPAFADLPLSFEPNRGQSARAVRFLARGPGYGLFLTRRGATLSLAPAGPAARGDGSALSLELVGVAARPRIEGVGRLPGVANYLGEGRDAVGIPTFAGVRYARVWPGIGMRFYGSRGRLEYDFDLAPGARPAAIDLRFAGQRRLSLAPDGALVLHLGGRTVRQPPPRAYQSGAGGRHPVAVRYTLRDGNRVGIAVGRHDRGRPLRIDPRIVYSTYLGAGIADPAYSVAVDSRGSAYLTGYTSSPRFPVTRHALQTGPFGKDVAYVAKLAPNGRHLVYSTYLGGPGGSSGAAIAVDRTGAAFVAGSTYPHGIPTTAGALQPEDLGFYSGFVAKLAPSGRRLLYSTYLGGPGEGGSEVNGIAIDRGGNAYLTGDTGSPGFPVTPGAAQTAGPPSAGPSPAPSAFVAKLNPSGSGLVYSTFLGGSEWDHGAAIAVDRTGSAYVTGFTASHDFPVSPGAFQTANRAEHEFWTAFVAKLSPTGTAFPYVTYLGGTGLDEGKAIAVDPAGRAHVTGAASSGDFPTTPGAVQRRRRGFTGAFVATVSADGSRLVDSTLVGRETEGRGIALDPAGNAYLVGFRGAPDRHGVNQGYRGFLAVLDPAEHRLLAWAKLGGSRARAASLALGPGGDVFAVGGSGPGLRAGGGLPHVRPPARADNPTAFVTRLRLSPRFRERPGSSPSSALSASGGSFLRPGSRGR